MKSILWLYGWIYENNKSLLGYVKDGTIAIPEIQRPFVWYTTKGRDLMDSLYN